MKVKIERGYADARREAYEREGLTLEALAIALIENDPAELAAIRAKRASVKARIPKGTGR